MVGHPALRSGSEFNELFRARHQVSVYSCLAASQATLGSLLAVASMFDNQVPSNPAFYLEPIPGS